MDTFVAINKVITPTITDGYLSSAHQCPSPNFNERPSEASVSLLVIHNISLPPGEFGGGFVQPFFLNQLNPSDHPYFSEIAAMQVSSHLLIERSGCVTQFVDFNRRAWHAGQSIFDGCDNCNDFSIGIELEGADDIDYTFEQYRSLVDISYLLMREYPLITPERITGHEHIAPGRKTDPGAAFNWGDYFRLLENRQMDEKK